MLLLINYMTMVMNTENVLRYDAQYAALLRRCLERGIFKPSRSGRQHSLFGVQMSIDLSREFPLTTLRKISFRIAAHEMLWILRGDDTIDYLLKNNIHIWDNFADDDGYVGHMYQWRHWESGDRVYDQLQTIVDEIREHPYSKRLVVSSWNVGALDTMSLPPCPHIFQFMVADRTLYCHLTQRAADLVFGAPYDIVVYALLTHIVAHITGLQVGTLFYNIADAHIYDENRKLARKMLRLYNPKTPLPQLHLTEDAPMTLDDFRYEHFRISKYEPTFSQSGVVGVGPLFQAFFNSNYGKKS